MRIRVWLVLLAALPLLTIGSGATAGTSAPPRNGLIAAFGGDGVYLIDAQRMKTWKVPGTAEMGDPAWSPDGSLLAVAGWDDNGNSVYTIRPDGSDRRLVLKNAWSPSWSPDGTRLAVVREANFESGGGILVTVRADGSDVQQVTFDNGKDPDGAGEPVWSPDGKWIAFFGGNGAVNLVSPNGSDDGFRAITGSGSGGAWNLAWSPDASKLAFDTVDKAHAYRQEITVFDLATGRRTTLPSRTPISALAWSPDGEQLAFLSARPMPKSTVGGCGGEMPMDLWLMNPDGSNPHLLSKGNYSQPSWGTFQLQPTPNSQPQPKPSLQSEPKPSLQPAPKPSLQSGPKPGLQSAPKPKPTPSAGSGPIAGTPSTSTAPSNATKTPRALPRVVATATTLRALGKGLIAARGRDAIYLIDPRRGDVRKIPGTAKMAHPAWSPDGSVLAVEHADASGTSVYTIRPDGSHPQLVLRNASSPSWSVDGKRLFVARNGDPSAVLMTVQLDGSDAREVDLENEDAYTDPAEPAFPSDGTWIGFYAEDGPSPVFDSSAAAWSPDAKHLAFVSGLPDEGASGKDSSPALWVVAADGGRPHRLATGIYGRPSWAASDSKPRSRD